MNAGAATPVPLLQVQDLVVSFPGSGGRAGRKRRIHAVAGVSFTIGPGETLGLVGESGSGKSTTARAVVKLVEPDSGIIRLEGVDLADVGKHKLRGLRRQLQMVFQDPYSSLDPSMTVGDSVGEPLAVHDKLRGRDLDDAVVELLQRVGLRAEHRYRYPDEFSGGQRQRVAIARAIAPRPQLIVCDESVSALDVSTQNQIINLLEDLQSEFQMSYLFIAHDLAVVRHIARRTAVMYLGRLVETGPTETVFTRPTHPYTETLISAIPVPNPIVQRTRHRIALTGDIPDPSDVPSGCPFHPRCRYAMDICSVEDPAPFALADGGEVRCHLHTSGPMLAGAPLSTLVAEPSTAAGCDMFLP